MAVGLVVVYGGPLAGRASGNVLSYVVGDTGPGKRAANKLQGLISSPIASRRAVIIPFEQLGSQALLFRNKNMAVIT